MNLRKLAVDILFDLIKKHRSLSVLSQEIRKLPSKTDRAYVQELCFGMARWYWQLNGITKILLRRPLKEADQDIYILILLGLYELLHMRTPDYAAVSKVVDTARQLGKPKVAGLVNAVLRNFLRNKAKILEKLEKNPVAKYSHPKWILNRLEKAWPDDWQNIVKANNQHPPMGLRVNEKVTSQEDYLRKLSAVGISARPVAYSSVGIELLQPCHVNELPGFAAGEIYVQDISAQLAVPLLELQADQRVLDACAAPGGKTCHLLESAQALKEVVAIDSSENRLKLLKENLMRSRLKATVLCADAAEVDKWWDGEPFDRILLDAPCSASGVIRRHPDIKLLRRNSDIHKLAAGQLKLLKALWPTLKGKGRLVYVVCSVFPEEGYKVIEQFLKETPNAKEISIKASWGKKMLYGRQILTGQNRMDGFYYACLTKIQDPGSGIPDPET